MTVDSAETDVLSSSNEWPHRKPSFEDDLIVARVSFLHLLEYSIGSPQLANVYKVHRDIL